MLTGDRSTCKCGAEILWTKVGACGGASMPVDPEPVEGGNIEATGASCIGGTPIVRVLTKAQREQPRGMVDPERYVSHFVTCAKAEEYRMGRPRADRPLPAQRHSKTSIAAAEQARPSAGTQRARVLAWLSECGPATDEQIADALGMTGNTERPRRVELVEAGSVRDSGEKGRTRSGRAATLWAVV